MAAYGCQGGDEHEQAPACDWAPDCPVHGILGAQQGTPDPPPFDTTEPPPFGPVQKWGPLPQRNGCRECGRRTSHKLDCSRCTWRGSNVIPLQRNGD